MIFYLLSFAISIAVDVPPLNRKLDEHWENYKIRFNKSYKDDEETIHRLTWEKAIDDINLHNLKADMGFYSYRLGINAYSDLRMNDIFNIMNGYHKNNRTSSFESFTISGDIHLPREIDWRKDGLVSKVKDQGYCGSGWAFSATGSLEGQHAKATGKMTELSEQNLIACSYEQGNFGCTYGSMVNAFKYVKENKGIDTEVSYPYTGRDTSLCQFERENVGATCRGYITISQGSERDLMIAVVIFGPVSVAINVEHNSFQHYRSGIYDEPKCDSKHLDHGVLVVGYGTSGGKDYWIVKNSWGKSWGENGYILMSRNKGNQCGIASDASIPVM